MNIRDGFTVSALRMLLSLLSVVIIIPMIGNLSDFSFYVSVSVYVLGKLIDLITKVTKTKIKLLFLIYMIGSIFSMIVIAMCFYGFADSSMLEKEPIIYNCIVYFLATVVCFTDVADFADSVSRLIYTKRKLRQFN